MLGIQQPYPYPDLDPKLPTKPDPDPQKSFQIHNTALLCKNPLVTLAKTLSESFL